MATTVETPGEELKPQRKEVEIRKVLAEKVRGHVKWYSASRRYGFISRNDDGGDLFVHRSVISSYSRRFPSLRSGEEVEFSVVETNHGIEATLVTGPNGQPVKGIKPMNRRYRTSSEPNDQATGQYTNPELGNDGVPRAKQAGRRSRGPRRVARSSNGVGDVPSAMEPNEQGDDKMEGRNGTHEHEADEVGGDAESPSHTVPRQRRRPPRRTPRHRSAPIDGGFDATANDRPDGIPDQPFISSHNEMRGQSRPFRRPFRPRGGNRYTGGYWNHPTFQMGLNGGPYGIRQRRFVTTDSYPQAPRRRGVGWNYPARSRRPPRPQVPVETVALNGKDSVSNGQLDNNPPNDAPFVEELATGVNQMQLLETPEEPAVHTETCIAEPEA